MIIFSYLSYLRENCLKLIKNKEKEMIESSTMTFLKALKAQNERPWFQEHKAEYLKAKENFDSFIQQLLLELSKEDKGYGTLRVKDCVFRIYRDVRFSKNKTPYKSHLAAGISKNGKRVHYPGMHVHIEPGNTYVGGGIWRPDKEMLYKIRQEIDYNLNDFETILRKGTFRKKLGTLTESDKLKRPPKGYDKENPAIEYLKLKSFIVHRKMNDKEVTSFHFLEDVMGLFKEMKPFLSFLELALDG